MDLSGKTVVVTGASSGIGMATAVSLADAGANLVLTARRRDRLEELAGTLPTRAALMTADIAERETPQNLLDLALAEFGRVDAIVNNAGIVNTGKIDDFDLDRLPQLMAVNFEAVVRSCYLFGRHFKAQGAGDIINISSIGAHKVPPAWAVYSGLKSGLETFTRSFRLSLLGTGVRVGMIAPGSVATEIFDAIPEAEAWKEGALFPEDVARGIRFMLEQPDRAVIFNMLLFADKDT